MEEKLYTTKTGSVLLGIKQDTLKHYYHKLCIGSQPGGPNTPILFTLSDLREIQKRSGKWEKSERGESREEFGLSPIFSSISRKLRALHEKEEKNKDN